MFTESNLRGCVMLTGSGLRTRRMDCSQMTRYALFVSDYHTNHTNHYVSQVAALKKLKLSDIIHAVTDINRGEIQENVFLWESGDPCPQPAQLNATEMDPCMYLKGDDERK